MSKARFIYDIPEKNADLYYATRFLAPDAMGLIDVNGKKFFIASDLEIDRAKKESDADEILSLSAYTNKAKKKNDNPLYADVLNEIFAEKGITELIVPQNMSFALVDSLRRIGIKIEAGPQPFYSERLVKNVREKKWITESQRVVFAAIGLVEEVLKKSRIKGNKLVFKGKTLTSEWVRQMVSVFLMEKGYVGEMIISSGKDALDPHSIGTGPLRPNDSIIVDIFPRSQKTLYFGDATRTFCRGKASDALKKLYATVKEGQALGLSRVKAGINGREIHEAITKFFDSKGYPTGEKNGRMQGFFHGTGHSLGLEIHEEPTRINTKDQTLKSGYVMSVEPGLYYEGIGGVRIEDLVYINDTGCEVLSKYPKKLEI